jgi:hypothetical protein
MSQHLAAWGASVNSAGALTNISAIADQAIFTSGNDIRVPTDLSKIVWEAAVSNQTGPTQGQVTSPSLRDLANLDIEPIVSGLVFGAPPQIQWHGDSPRDLVPYESMDFAILATGGAAAQNYGLVQLSDSAIKPVTGEIFTIRGTLAIALALNTWVNGGITFKQTLPAGRYQVVGMRVSSANLVAARLVFIGQAYRPGVLGNTSANNVGDFRFRLGRPGVYGEFDINQPPTVDALGVTDVAQEIVLDLIKTK